MKRDIKQVNVVAYRVGLTKEERVVLGARFHQMKKAAPAELSWEELLDLAEEVKRECSPPSEEPR